MKTGNLWKVEQSKKIEALRDRPNKRDEQKSRVVDPSDGIST
jgi:hypothetical protein